MKKINANTVKDYVKWLKDKDCGCCHFWIENTATKNMSICVGWHNNGEGWEIAWKIGMESFNNCMQCDLDIDFEMPYDAESGEVYDTLETIVDFANSDDDILERLDYEAIANSMNEAAPKAVQYQIEQERKSGEWIDEYAA